MGNLAKQVAAAKTLGRGIGVSAFGSQFKTPESLATYVADFIDSILAIAIRTMDLGASDVSDVKLVQIRDTIRMEVERNITEALRYLNHREDGIFVEDRDDWVVSEAFIRGIRPALTKLLGNMFGRSYLAVLEKGDAERLSFHAVEAIRTVLLDEEVIPHSYPDFNRYREFERDRQ